MNKNQTRLLIKQSRGFTLVEVLVVLGIIAILAALSLQLLAQFRKNAFDARALSDLKNTAVAEEAYFGKFEVFKSCVSTSACSAALPGVPNLSDGVVLTITATTSGFSGSASHPQGSGRTYQWESSLGGLQR